MIQKPVTINRLFLCDGLTMTLNLFALSPLALAYIMFVLGLQLKPKDFLSLKSSPKPLLAGLFSQMVVVPIIAFSLVSIFQPSPTMAFGMMLVSFCAGGATSNLMSFYAKGDVALSVTLTAITSLACVVTMPILISLSFEHFMGAVAGDFDSRSMSIKVFVLTTLPVLFGMATTRLLPQVMTRFGSVLQKLVNVVFALLVVGAVLSNWQVLLKQFVSIGSLVLLMVGILLMWGMNFAKLLGLPTRVQKTIAIETSLQNGAMGIALAPFIMNSTSGLPEIAIPAALYGVLMNFIVLPYVWYCQHQSVKNNHKLA